MIDKRINGWMDGWMDGWMNKCTGMDRLIDMYMYMDLDCVCVCVCWKGGRVEGHQFFPLPVSFCLLTCHSSTCIYSFIYLSTPTESLSTRASETRESLC